jgi:fido (protein-threonine AMPylation protein)
MLQEDTRHSLAIEGHLATEQQLKAVLQGRRSGPEIVNYFRTAQSLYDLALQHHLEGQTYLDLPLIRHIHSELWRDLAPDRGCFAAGGQARVIQGAKVSPPVYDVEAYMQAFVRVTMELLHQYSILKALARSHTLFEAIHPFKDGNGRAGRILLCFQAINQGYVPIVIKGLSEGERNVYYQALEAADRGFHQGFPPPKPHLLLERLEEGDFAPLEQLLLEGMLPRLDQTIARALAARTPLMDLEEVARVLGVPRGTLYQWRKRGRLIVFKPPGRRTSLLSHPWLFLGTQDTPAQTPEHFPPIRGSEAGQAAGLYNTVIQNPTNTPLN